MLKSIGDTTMQERYRMYRRNGGSYFAKDKITGKTESLGTGDVPRLPSGSTGTDR